MQESTGPKISSRSDHVTTKMKIYQEEIFGPVLSCVRVDNFEAALALVNAHAREHRPEDFFQIGTRHHQDEDLPGRNLRAGALLRARGQLRGSARARQRACKRAPARRFL